MASAVRILLESLDLGIGTGADVCVIQRPATSLFIWTGRRFACLVDWFSGFCAGSFVYYLVEREYTIEVLWIGGCI